VIVLIEVPRIVPRPPSAPPMAAPHGGAVRHLGRLRQREDVDRPAEARNGRAGAGAGRLRPPVGYWAPHRSRRSHVEVSSTGGRSRSRGLPDRVPTSTPPHRAAAPLRRWRSARLCDVDAARVAGPVAIVAGTAMPRDVADLGRSVRRLRRESASPHRSRRDGRSIRTWRTSGPFSVLLNALIFRVAGRASSTWRCERGAGIRRGCIHHLLVRTADPRATARPVFRRLRVRLVRLGNYNWLVRTPTRSCMAGTRAGDAWCLISTTRDGATVGSS
jgi:hypothetical protein